MHPWLGVDLVKLPIQCAHSSSLVLASLTAPSFVPRSYGVLSQPSKQVIASRVYGSSRRNDIKMMPIGVPKVAYRVPGSQSADW